MLFDNKVKDAFDSTFAQLRETSGLFSKGVLRVETQVLHNFTNQGKAGDFLFISDERAEAGGEAKGPTPLEYFLSGLGFCEQVIFIRHCAALGVHVDSLETTVRGYFDRRGIYGVADVDPGFSEIVVEMRIRSSETKEKILDAISKVEKHCPAYNTLRKAAKVTHQVKLNDKDLQYP